MQHPTPAPTRRSVLRAAAWSVPAVTVATAAPAYASSNADDTASGAFSLLSLGGAEWQPFGSPPHLRVAGLQVRSTRTSPVIPAQALTVSVTFPNHFVRYLGSNVDLFVTEVASGWTAGEPRYLGSGDRRHATVDFTYLRALQPGTGLFDGTTPLGFRARRGRFGTIQPLSNETPLPVVVQAPNCRSGSGMIVVVS